MIETSSYIVERPGPWRVEQIPLRFEKDVFLGPPDHRDLIQRNFRQQQAEALKVGRKLFNGKLARVRTVEGDAGGPPTLVLQPTDYVTFLTTNLLAPQDFPPEQRANALGLSGVLTTSDGRLLLGRRSERVSYNRGKIHTIGGVVEWSRTPPGGVANGEWLAEQLYKELFEELAMDPEEIRELRVLSLIRDRRVGQPELVCEVRLRLSSHALTQGWQRDGDIEHAELWSCPDRPEAVVDELVRDPDRFTPVAIATLLAYLSNRFGADALRPLMK